MSTFNIGDYDFSEEDEVEVNVNHPPVVSISRQSLNASLSIANDFIQKLQFLKQRLLQQQHQPKRLPHHQPHHLPNNPPILQRRLNRLRRNAIAISDDNDNDDNDDDDDGDDNDVEHINTYHSNKTKEKTNVEVFKWKKHRTKRVKIYFS